MTSTGTVPSAGDQTGVDAVARIAEALRADIASGAIPPGAYLDPAVIGARHGANGQAARTALAATRRAGLACCQRNRFYAAPAGSPDPTATARLASVLARMRQAAGMSAVDLAAAARPNASRRSRISRCPPCADWPSAAPRDANSATAKLYARLINGERGGYLGYAMWRRYLTLAHGYTASHKDGIVKYTAHELRHVCASLLIASGASDMQVTYQMGHSKVETTKNIYGQNASLMRKR